MAFDYEFREAEAIDRAQQRAAEIASKLGMDGGAPKAIPGESSVQFRTRVAQRLSQYSPEYRNQNLTSIRDPRLLDAVESSIYQSAEHHANNSPITAGKLRMVERRDNAGRIISEPSVDSDPRVWMSQFSNGAEYRGHVIDPSAANPNIKRR